MQEKIIPFFTSEINKEQRQKFFINIIKFSAPALAIFFAQLSQGVDVKIALPVALFTLYGLLSDFFNKLNK